MANQFALVRIVELPGPYMQLKWFFSQLYETAIVRSLSRGHNGLIQVRMEDLVSTAQTVESRARQMVHTAN